MVWKSLPAESGSQLRTEKKTGYRARKNLPCWPLPEIAPDGVHRAPHGLGRDQDSCQASAPEAAKEPASTGHGRAKKQEDANRSETAK